MIPPRTIDRGDLLRVLVGLCGGRDEASAVLHDEDHDEFRIVLEYGPENRYVLATVPNDDPWRKQAADLLDFLWRHRMAVLAMVDGGGGPGPKMQAAMRAVADDLPLWNVIARAWVERSLEAPPTATLAAQQGLAMVRDALRRLEAFALLAETAVPRPIDWTKPPEVRLG